MSWFFIALLGTLLWSIGNFVDKVLAERFGNNTQWSGTWGLVLYSSLFSLILIPVFLIFSPAEITGNIRAIGILMLAGAAEIVGIFLYLRALQDEDTSSVVPYFQTIPLFSFLLGFLILGETLTLTQALAGLGVVIGGVLLSLEINAGRSVSFKLSLVLLTLASSACFALFDALFKYGALQEGYWSGVMWQHVGIFVAGLLVFCVHKNARNGFLSSLQQTPVVNVGLNTINEIFYVSGVMFFLFALTLAPIALVATVNAFQPVFVFVVGALLTLIWPKFIKEDISRRHLFHKGLAIAVIVISSVFLVS